MKWARISWTGRIRGYIIKFGAPISHSFDPTRCIMPPRSKTQYDTFNRVAKGRISVGAHPSLMLDAAHAIAYYRALPKLARVTAHEDNYGIWIEGRIRLIGLICHGFKQPDFSPDWRTVNGRLELVAILAPPKGKPRKIKSWLAEFERQAEGRQ